MIVIVIIVNYILHEWICIQTLAFKPDCQFNSNINVLFEEKNKPKQNKPTRPKPNK